MQRVVKLKHKYTQKQEFMSMFQIFVLATLFNPLILGMYSDCYRPVNYYYFFFFLPSYLILLLFFLFFLIYFLSHQCAGVGDEGVFLSPTNLMFN